MSEPALAKIAELRSEVERVDAAIVSLLTERLAIVRAIGELKRLQQIPVVDPSREAAVVAKVAVQAREQGLPENDVRELFWRIMALSRREQLD